MTYTMCERVMDAIAVVADTKMSGIDLDDQIGVISLMIDNLIESRKNGYKEEGK